MRLKKLVLVSLALMLLVTILPTSVQAAQIKDNPSSINKIVNQLPEVYELENMNEDQIEEVRAMVEEARFVYENLSERTQNLPPVRRALEKILAFEEALRPKTMAEIYEVVPNPEKPVYRQRLYVSGKSYAEAAIDTTNLPEGTTYKWETTPSTFEPGSDFEASVRVTFSDGSFLIVPIFYDVIPTYSIYINRDNGNAGVTVSPSSRLAIKGELVTITLRHTTLTPGEIITFSSEQDVEFSQNDILVTEPVEDIVVTFVMPGEAVKVDINSEMSEVTSVEPLIDETMILDLNLEDVVFENGRLTIHNQTPGQKIAVELPNGKVLSQIVPYHGSWSPLQVTFKIYPGDNVKLFRYEGNVRGPEVELLIEGEGNERPETDVLRYGRQAFSFIPTTRDTRIAYTTEPFFTVELTTPSGEKLYQVANEIGKISFDGLTFVSGEVYTSRVFDRDGNIIDLSDPTLFQNPSINRDTTTVR